MEDDNNDIDCESEDEDKSHDGMSDYELVIGTLACSIAWDWKEVDLRIETLLTFCAACDNDGERWATLIVNHDADIRKFGWFSSAEWTGPYGRLTAKQTRALNRDILNQVLYVYPNAYDMLGIDSSY